MQQPYSNIEETMYGTSLIIARSEGEDDYVGFLVQQDLFNLICQVEFASLCQFSSSKSDIELYKCENNYSTFLHAM